MKLPQAFEEKMKGLLGEDFDSYIACFDNPRYYGLRVNTQKISVEAGSTMDFTMTGRRRCLPGIPITSQGFIISRSQAP